MRLSGICKICFEKPNETHELKTTHWKKIETILFLSNKSDIFFENGEKELRPNQELKKLIQTFFKQY